MNRTELLAHVDLAALADTHCGPRTGTGTGTRWRCPNPTHTDVHPSMNVFTGRDARQHFKCHACGAGGTAIDLLMYVNRSSAADAIVELTLTARSGRLPAAPLLDTTTVIPTAAVADPIIDAHATRCERILHTPLGRAARDWLAERGWPDDVAAHHRIGYDPGATILRRPAGLPRRGPGVVFPALDDDRHAVFFQTRYLDPDDTGLKYEHPRASLAPHPGFARLATPEPAPPVVIVCEGFPDAITATTHGYHAVAVLGAGQRDPRLVAGIAAASPHVDTFVVAFDNDTAGRDGATWITTRLSEHGGTLRLELPGGINDLNDWHLANPDSLARALDTATRTGPVLNRTRTRERGITLSL